ncbi:MAG: 30S ribosomal protein S1 [bacterium]
MASEETQEQPQPTPQGGESASTIFLEDEEDFETLYEESVKEFKEHQIINGKVIGLHKDFVTIDIGYKSEGQINVSEFHDENHQLTVAIGDEVEVFLEAIEDTNGIVVLSREKAEKLRVWERIGSIYEEDGTVEGVIASRIKGGLSVDLGIKAFLPGSQVDLRPVRNLDKLIGERFEFKILKFNQKRGNIVLSRRVLLEVDREERRKKTLAILTEGVLIKGYVKNITEYGVFIDLGGVDGLLHITDMTWGRIVHPSEMFNIGDEVEVVVLKFDAKEEKVSLGLKQKQANPWNTVEAKYPLKTRVQGKIVSLTDYGAFIELEPGVEGLIHVSEMSWTKKVRHPSKLFTLAQTVEAVVKDLDVERKRISLSIREAEPNPWETIHLKFPVGSLVSGKVRNITDFGIFVGLDDGIDGLVHISDLSWSQRQRKPSAFAKKGDSIEVKILHIDPDKERLSLGVKQLSEDPWKNLEDKVHINDEVQGRVVNVTDFGIFVEVLDGVEGLIHISEVDNDIRKEKLEEFYQVGSLVNTKVLKVDVDERRLGLGIVGGVGSLPAETELENTVLKDALADMVKEGGLLMPAETAPAEQAKAEEAPTEEPPAAEAKAEETPPEDAPVEQAKAQEAPAAEAKTEETPTDEPPVAEAKAEQTPPEEEPAVEAKAEDAPVEEAKAEETPPEAEPAVEAKAEDAPAEETEAKETPPEEEPAVEAKAEDAPVEETKAEDAPAEEAAPDKAAAKKPKAKAKSAEEAAAKPAKAKAAEKKPKAAAKKAAAKTEGEEADKAAAKVAKAPKKAAAKKAKPKEPAGESAVGDTDAPAKEA